jgi:solute carrier family 13 (sodium-dependent dicarboxylate transporter), member 2/3/5
LSHRPDEGGPRRPSPVVRVGTVLGPAFLLVSLVLPPPPDMGVEAWRAAGLALLMATWWVTEVVPLPITALLPLPLIPLLGISGIEAAAAPFANPVIFLFLGGFMIAQAMQRWDLHRRIAFGIIARTGTSPMRLVAGFMIAAAFLSMWVSNTAVAVMMLPIGVSVIQVFHGAREAATEPGLPDDLPASPFAVALLLGIAYACSIGGVATLIGTPPNALLAGFLADEFGVRIGFAQWMMVGLPMTLILLPLTWLLLTRVVFRVEGESHGSVAGVVEGLRRSLGAIGPGERRVAWVFVGTALAWMVRPLAERWIPGLTDAGIAIAATLILFLVPSGEREGGAVLNWEWARRIPWDVLLLFGGGLSLAAALSSSGLAAWIGDQLRGADQLPLVVLLLLVSGLIIFLTELMSNTASIAAFLPILAAIAIALRLDPLLLTVPATLAASCAFMLPVATPPNAIVFGSGYVRIGHMARAGIVLNLVVIVLVPALAWVAVTLVFAGIPSAG